MVLQAYMDESFDAEGVWSIGGYISTAERWAKFAEEWERELPNAVRGKGGAFEFKMSKMAQKPETMARVGHFHNIIHDHAIMAASISLDKRHIDNAFARLSADNVIIEWAEKLTPYFMCYRVFMEMFNVYRADNPDIVPIDGPVDFYFDDTTQKKQIIAVWDDFVAARPDGQGPLYGATPRFEDSKVFLPLQAADLMAWWSRTWANDLGMEGMHEGRYSGYTPPEKKIFHLTISMDEERLVAWIKDWMAENMIRLGIDLMRHPIRDAARPFG